MKMVAFAWANIKHRALGSSLTVSLLAISTGIIFLVLSTSRQLEQAFTNSLGEVDMVVGAKGSPLQLILSAVFHLDAPTGNIPLKELSVLRKNPQVQKIVPLSYGDNYSGFRIVGTDSTFLPFYGATLASGSSWSQPFEVVAGSKVAQLLSLGIGSTFVSSHGLDAESDHTHDERQFTVVGVLEPTGKPVDLLLLTNMESIWIVHDTHHDEQEEDDHTDHVHGPECDHDHSHEHEHEHTYDEREVTAALVAFKSSLGNVTIPRMINDQTSMQAALPAIEINRLFTLLGLGERVLTALAWVLLFVSGLSLFVSLYNSLKERKFELAMMRSFGASAFKVSGLLLTEAWLLTTVGVFVGFVLSRAGIMLLGSYSPSNSILTLSPQWPQWFEWLQLLWIYSIATIAAALPVIKVYTMDVSRTLTQA